MQIKHHMEYKFITDLRSGGLLTYQIDLNYSEVIFLSGDVVSVSSHNQFESLQQDFNIYKNIVIPADKYNFWRHSLQITSAKRRNFWTATKLDLGTFYSGRRTDWLMQMGYKVFVPVYIGLDSDRRYVNLPEGNFITQIYRVNLNFLFSPNISWYNFAQYLSQTETIGWQSRFQWIIKPGKELFLTFNSPLIDPLERFKVETYEARAKIKYTIRF